LYGEQIFGAFDKVIFRECGLPGEVCKGTVGLSHLMHIIALLHCHTFFLGSENKFVRKGLVHWDTLGTASGTDNPTECERETSLWAYFAWHLIVRTTNTA
jgi:hypothetical protein